MKRLIIDFIRMWMWVGLGLLFAAMLIPTVQAAYYKNPPDYKTFYRPMHEGQRLAWCYENQHYCGRAAANAFCRVQGYRHALGFRIDWDVELAQGINEKKPSLHHNGFKWIRCRL